MNKPLNDAVRLAGGESKLVERMRPYLPPGCKVARAHLYYWRTKAKTGAPAEFCRAIELAVGGRVTAAMLRPDVFAPARGASAPPPVEGAGWPSEARNLI
jgi:DNA-binding transcriptional regulator YdaS (Cro superfamily)